MITRFSLRQTPRPGDDGGKPDAALEQTELRPAITARAASAKMGALLGGMAVVALENDEGVLTESELVEFREEQSKPLILRRDEGGVEIARVRQVFEALEPLRVTLIGVVR